MGGTSAVAAAANILPPRVKVPPVHSLHNTQLTQKRSSKICTAAEPLWAVTSLDTYQTVAPNTLRTSAQGQLERGAKSHYIVPAAVCCFCGSSGRRPSVRRGCEIFRQSKQLWRWNKWCSGVRWETDSEKEKLSVRTCCILDEIAAADGVSEGESAPLGRVLDVWEKHFWVFVWSCSLSERMNPTVPLGLCGVWDTKLCSRCHRSGVYCSINELPLGNFLK